MFISAMIFTRLTSAGAISGGSCDDVLQRTVDAEADANAVLGGFDVHVGGTVAQRLRDDLVDDLDDGRVDVDDDFVGLVPVRARLSLAWKAAMSPCTADRTG